MNSQLVELLIAALGLAAVLLLGVIFWKYRRDLVNSDPGGRTPESKVTFLRSTGNMIILLAALSGLLGLTGFLAIPLGYTGIRDSLVLLHTIGGGFFAVVLVAFIIPRATGMGPLVRDDRRPTADTGGSSDRWTIISFWGIVTLGLVLVGTILAVLSASVSQAAQGDLINLHLLAAFLFILMLGLFTRAMNRPS